MLTETPEKPEAKISNDLLEPCKKWPEPKGTSFIEELGYMVTYAALYRECANKVDGWIEAYERRFK